MSESTITVKGQTTVPQPIREALQGRPGSRLTSMNGVTLHAQSTLAEACDADAVLFGSGMKTCEIAIR